MSTDKLVEALEGMVSVFDPLVEAWVQGREWSDEEGRRATAVLMKADRALKSPRTDVDREVVARVIDPEAFDEARTFGPWVTKERRVARAKADALMAMLAAVDKG